MELYRSLAFDTEAYAQMVAHHQAAEAVYVTAHRIAFAEALKMLDTEAGAIQSQFHPWYIIGQTIDEPFELIVDPGCILAYRAKSIKELIEAGVIEHRKGEYHGEAQYRLVT